MNEWILRLLSLCLIAKEEGINIWFEWAPHVSLVTVYVFRENTNEFIFKIDIYTDHEDANQKINEARKAIKDLISKKIKEDNA